MRMTGLEQAALSFRDAPTELGFTRVQPIRLTKSATADLVGAGPESITTIGSMDSGLALMRAPE
jgi:hypothetical protein